MMALLLHAAESRHQCPCTATRCNEQSLIKFEVVGLMEKESTMVTGSKI